MLSLKRQAFVMLPFTDTVRRKYSACSTVTKHLEETKKEH